MAGPDQASQNNTEVLNQTRKVKVCPMRMALGGAAMAATIAYFVLYSEKKPEASALDVAKVTTGLSSPENTRPRN